MPSAANHRFNAEESDWGFTRFAEIRKLFAPQWEDKGRPMVENDAVNVSAYLRIYKDPTGVLWHNWIKLAVQPLPNLSAESSLVTTQRKKLVWWVSRIKVQPVISIRCSNHCILRMLSAKYVPPW